jgi:hypothetical protein
MFVSALIEGAATIDVASWLLSALTVLVGFILKSVSDWVQHRHERERDREARGEARREKLHEQRRSFQREALLALQEAVQELGRVHTIARPRR